MGGSKLLMGGMRKKIPTPVKGVAVQSADKSAAPAPKAEEK